MNQVKIEDAFWNDRIRLVREVIIPYQKQVLNDELPGVEPSHAMENFRIAAGESKGQFHGMVFQDSDVAKWLEAVAYSLATHEDPQLEKVADDIIDLLSKAQQPDGYLNTYFTVAKPGQRWTKLAEDHELYCAGHLIEAAVAYYDATGKKKFLDVICRYADYIDSVFGTEPEKKKGYPGHEEIELALVKLYRVTGEERYLKLAKYFVDERGKQPNYFDLEYEKTSDKSIFRYPDDWDRSYTQSHLPVREQTTAEGHSVRAMYLYTAMADLSLETGDGELAEVCKALWDNVTQKRMYVTGGIGSQAYDEAFTIDYDLPNDTGYTETCASIGLAFFAQRMLNLDPDGKYGDVLETALYNGILSGMALDGKSFFYVNPLEVWPDACYARHDKEHVEVIRQRWFRCACCPPNLARLIPSLGQYIYSYTDKELFVHLYVGGTADIGLENQRISIVQRTDYPWGEHVGFTVCPERDEELTIAFRIPRWCKSPTLRVNGENLELESMMDRGYARVTRTWSKGDHVELQLPMMVRRIYAHPNVRVNAGKIALARGPMVYCLEEVDNGEVLAQIALPKDATLSAAFDAELLGGVVEVRGEGLRSENPEWSELYREIRPKQKPVPIRAIPYFAWNNRGVGEMLVWIRES